MTTTATTQLKGTEKQIKYAQDLRDRLIPKLKQAIIDVQELINQERELGETEEEIIQFIPSRKFGDLHFRVAFGFANKEIPVFGKPEKYVNILEMSLNHLNSLTEAKTIIDMCTPETTTVFVSEVIKKIKFKG
jgi:hypothetical protein